MPGVNMTIVMLLVGVLAVQAGWMPEAAVEGLAGEFAKRIQQAKVDIAPEKLLPAARVGVELLRDRLQDLGEQRLLGMAPALPRLKLPAAGQPHLDAMARYGMCTYYLESLFANLPSGADVDTRLDAAMGPLSLAVTTMYLRHYFLAGGGTDAQIKDYLAGNPLNAVAFAVQKDPKLLDYTATECRSAVSALLD
jgi:hypothetical protein